jgi:hypothetical protein
LGDVIEATKGISLSARLVTAGRHHLEGLSFNRAEGGTSEAIPIFVQLCRSKRWVSLRSTHPTIINYQRSLVTSDTSGTGTSGAHSEALGDAGAAAGAAQRLAEKVIIFSLDEQA